MQRFSRLPLVLQLTAIGALAMYVPAIHAFMVDAMRVARVYFYCATFTLVMLSMVALAIGERRAPNQARMQLLAILFTYTILPALLAVPFAEAIGDTDFRNAWFEMVSSITTTGATLYDPARLAPSLHLWRALVGWLGGLFTLVAALAILAPMNLGGFEVILPGNTLRGAPTGGRRDPGIVAADPSRRVAMQFRLIAPIYAALTVALWIGLQAAGEAPLVALCHAMATLSTSGISPIGGVGEGTAGRWGEALILIFFIFAICRRMLPTGRHIVHPLRLWAEPEVRLGVAGGLVVAVGLVCVHLWGAFSYGEAPGIRDALQAIWGAIFTVFSFLTTTGFASADWHVAETWSGLRTPGLVLMGLAIVGGGVATVTGGVKIMRIYALTLHGLREMQRILHPHSIGGQGDRQRHLRGEGAFVAWIFFMLFALSIAATVTLLSLTGLEMETALIFTISALTTTGPLAEVAPQQALSFAALDRFSRTVLAAAMVVGRIETLAIIALLAPDSWRR